MKGKKRVVVAKLVQRHGKNGVFMTGTLDGGQIPVVLYKSEYEKNEKGESIWNLYLDEYGQRPRSEAAPSSKA